nr:hypothetical protein [Tanacetum cinerariifolium]
RNPRTPKEEEEQVKACYIKYLDVFTSYFKTARVSHYDTSPICGIPTQDVEEDDGHLRSPQNGFEEKIAPNIQTADKKNKGKLGHFGITLEGKSKHLNGLSTQEKELLYKDIKENFLQTTSLFKSQKEMDHQYPTVAKIPVLDTGKFEQWQFQIQQYLQHEHYALWEVIEFGDSYKVPTNTDPDDTTTRRDDEQSGRTVTFTIKDMQKKKNDVKARTTLLLSLPDEHQLRFSKYKTAKELWVAILKTFGANEATKKRKKNLLKQQYGNFKAEGSKIWNKHLTDYNNEDANTACVTTASTAFPTGSVNVAIISQDTASAYIASQSNGSQIKFEDINQIDEDDMEEKDIKWSMALLSMRADKFWKRTRKKISIQGSDVAGFDKSKVKCFNCHKMSHFARECRAPRSQERGRKESYRQGSKAEEKTPKALMAIDGVG